MIYKLTISITFNKRNIKIHNIHNIHKICVYSALLLWECVFVKDFHYYYGTV